MTEDGSTPRKWSIGKAALYGAAAGIPLVILRATLLGGPKPNGAAEILGYLTAGMLVCALVFAVVAAIRNVLTARSE